MTSIRVRLSTVLLALLCAGCVTVYVCPNSESCKVIGDSSKHVSVAIKSGDSVRVLPVSNPPVWHPHHGK